MTSAMVAMSRAIRHTLEDYSTLTGEGLQQIPNEALVEFAEIVTAFSADLRAEINRRDENGENVRS